ncbi:hypothetical protein [uncultured Amnibacterium sp.]|uniref:hypothetical protein n=1 Tax=uncultured Amnibacterium sp. TaxID=1631851 RepID=UPI0035CAC7DE
MIVVVTATSAELVEPQVFTALAVRTSLPPAGLAAAVRLLGVGRMDDDGEHVWLRPTVLRDDGGADRTASLDSMTAFAAEHGWVDTAGRIRAHVERSDPAGG